MDEPSQLAMISLELMNLNATLIRVANLLTELAGKKSKQQRVTLVLEARRMRPQKRRVKRS